MADTTVVARSPLGQIDSLVIDAVVRETHSSSNTITDHPVEEGFNVSDHSRPEPDRISLECIISSTPISGKTQTITLANGVSATAVAKLDDTRVQDALDKLDALRTKGSLVDVVTSKRQYTSMGIETLSLTVDVKTGAALKFTVGMKFVRVVKNKLTTTTASKDKRASTKKKDGAATDKATDPEVESVANQGLEGGKQLLKTFGPIVGLGGG